MAPRSSPCRSSTLTSGYVQRSVQSFPKQGTRSPWQVHQNYLRDYCAMRLKGLEGRRPPTVQPDTHPHLGHSGRARPHREQTEMKHFNGKVAAITGAGSGIGRALALELARRGCHLA